MTEPNSREAPSTRTQEPSAESSGARLHAEQIQHERQTIVAEALTWRGTPYHPNARVKGQGADCLTFIAGVFETLLGPIEVPHYPKDWHFHQDRELYLEGVLTWGGAEYTAADDPVRVANPWPLDPALPRRPVLPGDIILAKFGRCFSHGAIATDWPKVIHAYSRRPCGRDDFATAATLTRYFENGPDKGKPRPRRFFTLSRWI